MPIDDPATLANDFIEQLVKDTGVSRRFLEAARPSIETAFRDVPLDRRPQCLDAIREATTRQAETELILDRAAIQAAALERSQERSSRSLQAMSGRLRRVRDLLVGAQLSAWGPFSDELPPVGES